MAQRQRHHAAGFEVEIGESAEIDIGENVSAVDQERLLSEKGSRVENSASGLEQIRLVNERDFFTPVGSGREKIGKWLRQMMCVDDELLHTGRNRMIQSKCY